MTVLFMYGMYGMYVMYFGKVREVEWTVMGCAGIACCEGRKGERRAELVRMRWVLSWIGMGYGYMDGYGEVPGWWWWEDVVLVRLFLDWSDSFFFLFGGLSLLVFLVSSFSNRSGRAGFQNHRLRLCDMEGMWNREGAVCFLRGRGRQTKAVRCKYGVGRRSVMHWIDSLVVTVKISALFHSSSSSRPSWLPSAFR